jgi:hypothetical protein
VLQVQPDDIMLGVSSWITFVGGKGIHEPRRNPEIEGRSLEVDGV